MKPLYRGGQITYSALGQQAPLEDKVKWDPDFTKRKKITPVSHWERLKIGGGTPPILTKHGWLIVYHGVSDLAKAKDKLELCYSAGVMILSEKHPHLIHYRSEKPVFTPELLNERSGVIDNVVFPTGIDRRDDIGQPNRFDVYYGMADKRIGVARLDLPDVLTPKAVADPPKDKV